MKKKVEPVCHRLRAHWMIGRATSFLIALTIMASASVAQEAVAHPDWPGPGQLFVGTCYQPIDRSPEQIDRDIAIMKHAGFNVVRMGDLSWDSFEPEQGRFKFEWFDKIMDKMQASGIRVILDIPGSPAPIWLHRKYPGVDIVNQYGKRLPSGRTLYGQYQRPRLHARGRNSRGCNDEAVCASSGRDCSRIRQ